MTSLTNPKLAAIDEALSECEPCLDAFANSRGFTLTRSHDGSFNVPRRWLHRESSGVRHEIGLIIALPMSERLERGFYPDIPCTIYVSAFDRAARKHYHSPVCEAQPFSLFRDSLSHHLADAIAKVDACTSEFILQYGVDDQAA